MPARFDRPGARAVAGTLATLRHAWSGRSAWLLAPGATLAEHVLAAASNREDAELAREIVDAGRAAGLSRLHVRLQRRAGFDLGVPVKGAPIRFAFGADGVVEVDAEYDCGGH